MRKDAAGHQKVWVRRRFRAAWVALIIGAWGRVGRLGSIPCDLQWRACASRSSTRVCFCVSKTPVKAKCQQPFWTSGHDGIQGKFLRRMR
jgi:hypothetical protein